MIPEKLFTSCFVISLCQTFQLIPKTDLCFISDHKNLNGYPENTLTKYDFNQAYQFDISKDLDKITSSSTSAFRGLDLAYKLNPQIILIAGIDFSGQTNGINYDDEQIQGLLNNEAEKMSVAIEKIRSEGIKVFNISPYSKLKQDLTIEEFYDTFINGSNRCITDR